MHKIDDGNDDSIKNHQRYNLDNSKKKILTHYTQNNCMTLHLGYFCVNVNFYL